MSSLLSGAFWIGDTEHEVGVDQAENSVLVTVDGAAVVLLSPDGIGVCPARPQAGLPADPADGVYPKINLLEDDVSGPEDVQA